MTLTFSLRDGCFVGKPRIGSLHLGSQGSLWWVDGGGNNDVFSVCLLEATKLGKPVWWGKILRVNASVG